MNNILEKNDSFLGFTENMKAMQRGRVEKVLVKKFRYDGQIMERRDHILNLILNGSDVFSYEDSKTCYGIRVEKGSSRFYPITKNEYDFGMYLIENGFITNESVINKIDAEAEEKKYQKMEEADKQAQKKAAKEAAKAAKKKNK